MHISPPLVIGILSDTHGYFHPNLLHYLKDVDLILHAGDVGGSEILDGLSTVTEVRAVWGNIDGWDLRREHHEHSRCEVGGAGGGGGHIAGRPGRWQRGIEKELEKDPPDVFICGHSHILCIERVEKLNKMLFINPGAAGRQGFQQVKSLVRLHIQDGKAIQAEVIHLDD